MLWDERSNESEDVNAFISSASAIHRVPDAKRLLQI